VSLAMQEYGLADASATEVVRASDAQRARFVRKVTGRDWCDAALYDLSLNTGTTGLERAAALVVELMRHARGTPAG